MERYLLDAQLHKNRWRHDRPFKENMLAVMEVAWTDAFMAITEDEKFKAACGAALLCGSEEDKEWITVQLRGLGAVSAMINASRVGLSVNGESFAAIGEECEKVKRDYSLHDLWCATKEKLNVSAHRL